MAINGYREVNNNLATQTLLESMRKAAGGEPVPLSDEERQILPQANLVYILQTRSQDSFPLADEVYDRFFQYYSFGVDQFDGIGASEVDIAVKILELIEDKGSDSLSILTGAPPLPNETELGMLLEFKVKPLLKRYDRDAFSRLLSWERLANKILFIDGNSQANIQVQQLSLETFNSAGDYTQLQRPVSLEHEISEKRFELLSQLDWEVEDIYDADIISSTAFELSKIVRNVDVTLPIPNSNLLAVSKVFKQTLPQIPGADSASVADRLVFALLIAAKEQNPDLDIEGFAHTYLPEDAEYSYFSDPQTERQIQGPDKADLVQRRVQIVLNVLLQGHMLSSGWQSPIGFELSMNSDSSFVELLIELTREMYPPMPNDIERRHLFKALAERDEEYADQLEPDSEVAEAMYTNMPTFLTNYIDLLYPGTETDSPATYVSPEDNPYIWLTGTSSEPIGNRTVVQSYQRNLQMLDVLKQRASSEDNYQKYLILISKIKRKLQEALIEHTIREADRAKPSFAPLLRGILKQGDSYISLEYSDPQNMLNFMYRRPYALIPVPMPAEENPTPEQVLQFHMDRLSQMPPGALDAFGILSYYMGGINPELRDTLVQATPALKYVAESFLSVSPFSGPNSAYYGRVLNTEWETNIKDYSNFTYKFEQQSKQIPQDITAMRVTINRLQEVVKDDLELVDPTAPATPAGNFPVINNVRDKIQQNRDALKAMQFFIPEAEVARIQAELDNAMSELARYEKTRQAIIAKFAGETAADGSDVSGAPLGERIRRTHIAGLEERLDEFTSRQTERSKRVYAALIDYAEPVPDPSWTGRIFDNAVQPFFQDMFPGSYADGVNRSLQATVNYVTQISEWCLNDSGELNPRRLSTLVNTHFSKNLTGIGIIVGDIDQEMLGKHVVYVLINKLPELLRIAQSAGGNAKFITIQQARILKAMGYKVPPQIVDETLKLKSNIEFDYDEKRAPVQFAKNRWRTEPTAGIEAEEYIDLVGSIRNLMQREDDGETLTGRDTIIELAGEDIAANPAYAVPRSFNKLVHMLEVLETKYNQLAGGVVDRQDVTEFLSFIRGKYVAWMFTSPLQRYADITTAIVRNDPDLLFEQPPNQVVEIMVDGFVNGLMHRRFALPPQIPMDDPEQVEKAYAEVRYALLALPSVEMRAVALVQGSNQRLEVEYTAELTNAEAQVELVTYGLQRAKADLDELYANPPVELEEIDELLELIDRNERRLSHLEADYHNLALLIDFETSCIDEYGMGVSNSATGDRFEDYYCAGMPSVEWRQQYRNLKTELESLETFGSLADEPRIIEIKADLASMQQQAYRISEEIHWAMALNGDDGLEAMRADANSLVTLKSQRVDASFEEARKTSSELRQEGLGITKQFVERIMDPHPELAAFVVEMYSLTHPRVADFLSRHLKLPPRTEYQPFVPAALSDSNAVASFVSSYQQLVPIINDPQKIGIQLNEDVYKLWNDTFEQRVTGAIKAGFKAELAAEPTLHVLIDTHIVADEGLPLTDDVVIGIRRVMVALGNKVSPDLRTIVLETFPIIGKWMLNEKSIISEEAEASRDAALEWLIYENESGWRLVELEDLVSRVEKLAALSASGNSIQLDKALREIDMILEQMNLNIAVDLSKDSVVSYLNALVKVLKPGDFNPSKLNQVSLLSTDQLPQLQLNFNDIQEYLSGPNGKFADWGQRWKVISNWLTPEQGQDWLAGFKERTDTTVTKYGEMLRRLEKFAKTSGENSVLEIRDRANKSLDADMIRLGKVLAGLPPMSFDLQEVLAGAPVPDAFKQMRAHMAMKLNKLGIPGTNSEGVFTYLVSGEIANPIKLVAELLRPELSNDEANRNLLTQVILMELLQSNDRVLQVRAREVLSNVSQQEIQVRSAIGARERWRAVKRKGMNRLDRIRDLAVDRGLALTYQPDQNIRDYQQLEELYPSPHTQPASKDAVKLMMTAGGIYLHYPVYNLDGSLKEVVKQMPALTFDDKIKDGSFFEFDTPTHKIAVRLNKVIWASSVGDASDTPRELGTINFSWVVMDKDLRRASPTSATNN